MFVVATGSTSLVTIPLKNDKIDGLSLTYMPFVHGKATPPTNRANTSVSNSSPNEKHHLEVHGTRGLSQACSHVRRCVELTMV